MHVSAILPVANKRGPATEIYNRPAQRSPGRTGRGGGGMAGEASRPRSPPPRRPRPRPDLQLTPLACGSCVLLPAAPRSGGGGGAAGPAMRPPTRRGVHLCRCMYAHITWRGTRGWGRRKVAVLGCGRAVVSVSSPRSSSGFTRHTATPAHYQTVAPARR